MNGVVQRSINFIIGYGWNNANCFQKIKNIDFIDWWLITKLNSIKRINYYSFNWFIFPNSYPYIYYQYAHWHHMIVHDKKIAIRSCTARPRSQSSDRHNNLRPWSCIQDRQPWLPFYSRLDPGASLGGSIALPVRIGLTTLLILCL